MTFCVGRAVVARRSHKPEVAGSNPAPATISARAALPLRPGPASAQLPAEGPGAGETNLLPVSPAFQFGLLKPLALHAGLAPAQLVERLLIDHARTLRLDHLVAAVIRESSVLTPEGLRTGRDISRDGRSALRAGSPNDAQAPP